MFLFTRLKTFFKKLGQGGRRDPYCDNCMRLPKYPPLTRFHKKRSKEADIYVCEECRVMYLLNPTNWEVIPS
jgi:hypothetical protein